jgi:hypothetical protein
MALFAPFWVQFKKNDYICVMVQPKLNKIKPKQGVADVSTGEIFPASTTVNVVDNDLVIIHSKEYVIIDSCALQYIIQNFTTVDYGRILKMADMVNGSYNILFHNRQEPHSDATLMEELDYTRNKYADFMKRLYRKSIISYIHTVKDGKEFKYIMLNPHLARKRKTIDKNCLSYFDELGTNSKK